MHSSMCERKPPHPHALLTTIAVCKESNVLSRRSEAALCAFVSASDEAWLEQWLEYHSMMGIDVRRTQFTAALC